MLLQKPATKKEKKKATNKKIGISLILLGLFLITIALFIAKFFNQRPLFVSPLSQNQESSYSKLESEFKKSKIEYQRIDTNSDTSYSIKLGNDEEVIIDSKKDILQQLSSLQLIVAQLKIDGKTFRRLDFRYQKPVITF